MAARGVERRVAAGGRRHGIHENHPETFALRQLFRGIFVQNDVVLQRDHALVFVRYLRFVNVMLNGTWDVMAWSSSESAPVSTS